VFSLIGEQFEDDGTVGAVLSLRKQDDYVSVWVRDNEDRFRIGYDFIFNLSLIQNSHFSFIFYSFQREIETNSQFRCELTY
jgi:hypothetical protein